MDRELDPRISFLRTANYRRQSNVQKFLSWIFASIHLLFLLIFRYRKYYVLYYTNPPLSYLCSLIVKNPFSIVVFDVYPEALKTAGISESSWVFKKWSKWNKKLFSRADQVTTLSQGMKKLVVADAPNAQVEVISPWPGSDLFQPIPKEDNAFRQEHAIGEKFVLLYSGNLGATHQVEKIAELARVCRDNEQIQFVVIGEGVKKKLISDFQKKYKLDNLLVLGFQDAAMLPHSLSAGDLGIITLEKDAASLSVPSKTFNLLAVGAPLLCLCSGESELARLVEQYNNGAIFDPENLEETAKFIKVLAQDKERVKQFSLRSLEAAKAFHFSKAKQYFTNV
ncbi:glycosyltransferase family 4 protein [Akkermansiaceae bacterium]|nr:glycosyltransferase family 4 protein [Akkermansiaceae bacterium]